jgi:hypothetical protein
MRQVTIVVALILGILSLSACAGSGPMTRTSAAGTHGDPRTKRALLRIAGRFNRDYSTNHVGAVYDRWDARSRTIITRADYIRRHRECRTNPGPATTLGATSDGSWWLVRYSISGISNTDYWRYERGRWVFDLFRSNPQAVHLYRLPGRKYIAAVGCKGGA